MDQGLERTVRRYRGIDFAASAKASAALTIADDGNQIQVCASDAPANLTAVDCPFGTTIGFHALLQGRVPSGGERDGFKSRATEHHVRKRVKAFGTCRWWSTSSRRRSTWPGAGFFNPSSHVQATLRLAIVPAGIAEVLRLLKLERAASEERIQGLVMARRGEGAVVEAHPRIFLYSAIERIFGQAGRKAVSLEDLRAAVRYKVEKAGKGRNHRSRLYALLRDNPVWMGQARRDLEREPPNVLLESNHGFDAWLCALTAWAHSHGETVGWREAGLSPEEVDVEGHMLLLRTEVNR